MGPGLQVTVVAAAVCAVVLVALAVVLLVGARRRRRLTTALSDARQQIDVLQDRVDALAREVRGPEPRPEAATELPDEDGPDYVITTAGQPPSEPAVRSADLEPLTARQFASVAVGESLVRVVSLGYGVRRALSAENRNRIGFEMRREVRRSRKERKRRLRLVRRGLRNADASPAGRDAA